MLQGEKTNMQRLVLDLWKVSILPLGLLPLHQEIRNQRKQTAPISEE